MTALSADRPSIDPKDDLFGRYPGSDGLVLALYGPWGSGKSTVLSYVQHFLEQRAENEKPVLVKFNPWWFSGQENLARAFLGQLQAVLPARSEKFKQLGDLLADFAEGVGGLIDLTGVSGGAGGLIGKLLGQAKRKPKDVPALKNSITGLLQKAGQRILVIIEDMTEKERLGRVDIAYRTNAGKHVIVELKKVGPKMGLLELVEQGQTYVDKLKKILREQNDVSPNIEVIFVLGKTVDEEASNPDRLKSSMTSISPGSRIVHYDTLIRGAQEAYSAYIEKSKSLDKLAKIVDRI